MYQLYHTIILNQETEKPLIFAIHFFHFSNNCLGRTFVRMAVCPSGVFRLPTPQKPRIYVRLLMAFVVAAANLLPALNQTSQREIETRQHYCGETSPDGRTIFIAQKCEGCHKTLWVQYPLTPIHSPAVVAQFVDSSLGSERGVSIRCLFPSFAFWRLLSSVEYKRWMHNILQE
jgi:hypothetical protein